MILTQTRDGKIHTVNRYMAQLLGQSIEVLKGRLFIELVEDGMGKDYYDSNRINLVSSSLHRLEHEGSVIDAKGEQRHIIWLHTYIGQTQLNDVVVLMPNTSAAGAEAFAGSLNGRLGQRKFQFDNKEYQITASIGIALMPQHGKDVEELMINVDTAMYTAKKEGRGQHCVYSPESRAAKKRRDNYGAF